MSLFNKSINGFIWSFLNSIGMQLINFIVQIILARILSPEVFGTMAIIQVFLTIGLYLMDGGMGSSLIRMKNPTQDDYSTVFYTNVFFGVIIFGAIWFIAPYVATFYSLPDLTILIRVISSSFLIRSFAATQMAILTKEMDFKKLALIQLPSILISGVIGVITANFGYGIWSLVILNIAQALIFTISFWLQSKWRPSFVFKKKLFKYHFNFGFKISLTNVVNGVFDNIYNMVIGKTYNVLFLSYYNRAETVSNAPRKDIVQYLRKGYISNVFRDSE
ncbi:oligosaccharide flippase family protein [Sphingobacterium sp. SG20118]|uniref:oligosaccharide flippase family protein n=1 Tax=Sphingobacterium sp. SG20118 TaxID=3367156 RepID=UPI0037DFBE19